jgi:hypothetical protein
LNDAYQSIRSVVSFRAIKIDKKMLTLLEFPSRNTAGTLFSVSFIIQTQPINRRSGYTVELSKLSRRTDHSTTPRADLGKYCTFRSQPVAFAYEFMNKYVHT